MSTDAPQQKRALFSLWNSDKTEPATVLAKALLEGGYELIASGGTKTFLADTTKETVIDTADLTGLKPALEHRVATLTPQLHGGLLAEQKHFAELDHLGWPWIDLVVVTFYPLQQVMADSASSDADMNNAVDVGGPTLVTSGSKGGRIVVTDAKDFEWLANKIRTGTLSEGDKQWLQALATTRIAEYRAAEARFRVRRLRPQ
ncbi:MAG: bifunctional phosphoribosylaminoimidazolecarboxamide formyltransferase/IMP cyclohydrolase [Candidatus Parcubacteria bacterium]|jgi:phosphoribosylaminoimidazolecarboxamide formyltransferase/IMP cyclohydrolase